MRTHPFPPSPTVVTLVIARARRHVYILGENPRLDASAAVGRSAEARAELVLLCLGRRLSERQQNLVEEAVRLAGELTVDVDAEWIERFDRLESALTERDDVKVLADGRELERIERVVARRRGRPTIWSAPEP